MHFGIFILIVLKIQFNTAHGQEVKGSNQCGKKLSIPLQYVFSFQTTFPFNTCKWWEIFTSYAIFRSWNHSTFKILKFFKKLNLSFDISQWVQWSHFYHESKMCLYQLSQIYLVGSVCDYLESECESLIQIYIWHWPKQNICDSFLLLHKQILRYIKYH